jgi:hypothetical protein
MEGHVEWTMAAPLWPLIGDAQNADDRLRFRTPTILRFATDSFMEEFLNLLNTEPQRLNEYVAAPETWNSPPSEPTPPVPRSGMALALFRARNAAVRRLQARGSRVVGQLQTVTPGKVLKLYQAAHGRFYLVATCLACRMLGLPDRRIDAGAQERATFVLRLLQPHSGADPQNPDPRDCNELALVKGQWQPVPVTDPGTFVEGEEQHPLSPVAYAEDDQRRRRLLVGLIPVGDRERLLQAAQPNPAGQVPPPPSALPPLVQGPPSVSANGTMQMLLKSQVIGPMKNLEDVAIDAVNAANGTPPAPLASPPQLPTPPQAKQISKTANERIQAISWYILLDLAKYFERNLPDLLQVILGNADASTLSAAEQTVWNTLSQTTYSGTTFASALKQAYPEATTLEKVTSTYQSGATDWPSFRFQFQAVVYDPTGATYQRQELTPRLDREAFESQIVQALPTADPNPPLPVRSAAQAYANPQAPVWFTIRCVFERPNCGALTPPLVSEPTVAFQFAAYFDPDAPARPIRIGLPVDTTLAGLRKFDKNTAFVMSDTLCGQVKKMSSISFADLIMSVLPFPLHKDLSTGDMQPCGKGGTQFGMVCSFSIPIITIVALILLIIFVKLLDIVFYWMPFFQICLPLPKFSAKES